MSEQLRDLLEAAVGEPPHRVRVEAVRRRARRSRGCPGQWFRPGERRRGPGRSATRFYVKQGYKGGPQPAVGTVVRATRTGVVTATVHSPWPEASIAAGLIAAARHRTFFIVCQRETGKGDKAVTTGSRIYRFRLTSAGRIAGYSLVPGGSLDGLQVSDVAVIPDGSEVAVSAGPGGPVSRSASANIMVIGTRTGARAVWHGSPAVPGKIAFGVNDLSLTADGRGLVYLAIPRCIAGRCRRAAAGPSSSSAPTPSAVTCSSMRDRPAAACPTAWIHHGRLFPLTPADGSNVAYEAW